MTVREYIGARYVPLFIGEWDNTVSYEPLSIVQREGNSFTSRQYVPTGIDIDNEEYWAKTGNFNAQVEQYREEVAQYREDITTALEEMQNITTVDNMIDLLETTDDYVLVLNNSSNETMIYETTNAITNTITRSDGSHVIPSPLNYSNPTGNAPMNAICKIMQGYIRNDNLEYGNNHTLFDEEVSNEIDCSAFVSAILNGISYDNSRYVIGGSSENRISSMRAEGIDTSIHKTWTLVNYFLNNKRFYLFKRNTSEIYKIQPGDILFFSESTWSDRVFYVGHCAIVLQIFPKTKRVLIAQVGSHTSSLYSTYNTTAKFSVIDFDYVTENLNGDSIIGFGRPNYGVGSIVGNDITAGFKSSGDKAITNDSLDIINLGTLVKNRKLKLNTLYTLVLEGKLPNYVDDKCYLVTTNANADTSDTSKVVTQLSIQCSPDGKRMALFFEVNANTNYMVNGTIYIAVMKVANAVLPDNLTFRIDKASLYEGFASIYDSMFKPISLIDYGYDYSCYNENELKIKMQFNITEAVNAGSDYELETLSSDVFKTAMIGRMPIVAYIPGSKTTIPCILNCESNKIVLHNNTGNTIGANSTIVINTAVKL